MDKIDNPRVNSDTPWAKQHRAGAMKAGAVGGMSLLSQQPWSEVPLQALAGSTVRGVNTFFPQELWLLSFFRPPTGGGKERKKTGTGGGKQR